jgi:catechol 2,3-dioxygenase-like lactoylglutathione lyase family enzyme
MPEPSSHEIGPITQIAVSVHNLARSAAFYRDQLKLPFLFEAPGLAFFQSGDLMLMLSLPSTPEFDHPSGILYFKVENIDASYQLLIGRGVPFMDAPHIVHRTPDMELWMAFFRDPDENVMAIREARPCER